MQFIQYTLYILLFLSFFFFVFWELFLRLLADLGRRFRHFGCGIVVHGG